jgi:hypothetical protein
MERIDAWGDFKEMCEQVLNYLDPNLDAEVQIFMLHYLTHMILKNFEHTMNRVMLKVAYACTCTCTCTSLYLYLYAYSL